MTEQGPSAEVLGLKDALLLGIEDILKKDTPERLDLFFQEKDQSMHLSEDLIKKLQDTLGVVWTKNPPDEPLGNWAINLFLAHYAVDDLLGNENGGVKSPFLPFKGYTLVSEKRVGNPRLWISAELAHQKDKMSSDALDFEDFADPNVEVKPTISSQLTDVIKELIRIKPHEKIGLFLVRNIDERGINIEIIPADIISAFLHENQVPEALWETEFREFLRITAKGKLPEIRTDLSRFHRKETTPSNLEGYVIQKEPYTSDSRPAVEFSLTPEKIS